MVRDSDAIRNLLSRVGSLETFAGSITDRVEALEQGGDPSTTPQVSNFTELTTAVMQPGQCLYRGYVYPRDGASFDSHDTEMDNLRTSDFVNVPIILHLLDRDSDTVPSGTLDNIAASLTAARNAGFLAILGFIYDYSGSALNDPAPARVLTHINQVAGPVNDNKDVVLAAQARFLGKYGEWFDSANHGSDNWPIADNGGALKAAMMQRIFDQFHDDIRVLNRYPRHERYFANDENYSGLTPNPGSPRITPVASMGGNHDDSMMESEANGGTYDWAGDWRGDKAWQIEFNKLAVARFNMGEQEDFGDQSPEAQAARIARFDEFRQLRYSILSFDYSIGTTDMWKSVQHPTAGMTYWEVLKRYLGHRIIFKQIRAPLTGVAGQPYTFTVDIENKGYNTPLRDYVAKVRFAGGTPVTATPSVQPTNWEPGVTTPVQFTCTIPAGTGNKPLEMALVDPNAGLTDLRFNLKPCVAEYQAANGYVDLKSAVTVS